MMKRRELERKRLLAEARRAIDRHLDRVFGNARKLPNDSERSALWWILHRIRERSLSQIASGAELPLPTTDGKVTVSKVISRYAELIDLPK